MSRRHIFLIALIILGFAQMQASPCRNLINKAANLLLINRDSALHYASQGLTIAEFEENDTLIGMALMVRGEAFFKLGKFEDAKRDFARKQQLAADHGERGAEALAVMWMGECYMSQDSFFAAEEGFALAYSHYQILREDAKMVRARLRQGRAIEARKEMAKAREHYSEALKIARKAELKEESALAHQHLGFISQDMGKSELALQHLRNALVNFEQVGNAQERAVCLKGLGKIHLDQKKYKIAEEYAQEGLKVAQESGSRALTMDFYQLLGDIMAAQDDFEKATDYYKLNALVRDSLAGNAGARELSEIVLQYEKEKAVLEKEKIQQDMQLQAAMIALNEAEIKRQRTRFYLILGGLVLALLFGGTLAYLFVQKNRANQKLQKALADLQRAQDQLVRSEKMASLGQVTAGIAHEIRNPLNFVTNLSKLSVGMIDEVEEELEDAKGKTLENQSANLLFEYFGDIKDNTKKVLEHGERAGRIVRDMLQHAATESAEKLPFALNELVEEYMKVAYHSQPNRSTTGQDFNCELEFVPDNRIGELVGIRSDIGRALLNILTNAFEAMALRQEQEGDAYHPHLRLRTELKGKQVQISIADNGQGVPKEQLNRIFDPFFTTKPPNKGTGLGLSLAHETIVRTHGGQLQVSSEVGKGTEFRIVLPLES